MSTLMWLRRSSLRRHAGPEVMIRRFSPELDIPIAADIVDQGVRSRVSEIDNGWRLVTNVKRVFHLFDVSGPESKQDMLIYRAELRSRDVDSAAYLEMWCRVPGDGEYFVKGSHKSLKGDSGWQVYEIPFFFRSDQFPDRIRLNMTFDRPGIVEMRSVTLSSKTLSGLSSPRQAVQTSFWILWRSARFVALMMMNIVLFIASLALEHDLTRWPKDKGPSFGKFAG